MSRRRNQPANLDDADNAVAAGKLEAVSRIVPAGRLAREDRDSVLTGGTRSLQRRVLGLGVLNQPAAARATARTRPAKPHIEPTAKPRPSAD